MIYGIGIDIVAINRVKKNIEQYKDRFARKILCEKEMLEYSNVANTAEFLAKRFAAKEAFVKALGTGFKPGIYLKDIQVSNNASGKPGFQYTGKIQDIFSANGIISSHLTLSDEKDYACACVILEK